MEELMKAFYLLLTLLVLSSCREERKGFQDTETETAFDAILWQTRQGEDYPYRDQMLNALFRTDTLKGMSPDLLETTLGAPDRSDGNFRFYRIAQRRAGVFPLHTKTLVIELAGDTVRTVRLHE